MPSSVPSVAVSSQLPPGPRRGVPGKLFFDLRRHGLLGVLVGFAKAHGDFVYFRIGRRAFCLVSDPEVIRRVLVTDNALFTKSHALAAVKKALGEGLLTSDGDLHKSQRKMIGPAFHASQVKAYADDFVTQARRIGDGWRDGESLDIGEAMTELTLRVVTKSLFDTELEEEVKPIGRDMATLVGMFERIRNPLAALLEKLPLASNRRYRAALGRLDARINGMIDARRREAEANSEAAHQRFDLLSMLLNSRDEGGMGMSAKQARDEAVTLFMAGHETTANALIWTWLLLAENPDAESALHAELDAVLDGDSPATADDMAKLKYTRAVVSESMRLRPPAWIVGRLATQPYAVGPYRVPAGTTILTSQYIVHRDPRWWPDAETFRPERWLTSDSGERQAERPKYAYFPFGGGARSCVGEPFAWMEAVLLLATLARHWRLTRDDAAPVRLFATITLRPKDVVRMTPRRRI